MTQLTQFLKTLRNLNHVSDSTVIPAITMLSLRFVNKIQTSHGRKEGPYTSTHGQTLASIERC